MSRNRISFSLFTFVLLSFLACNYVGAVTYDGSAPTAPSSITAVTQNSPSLHVVISWSAATDNKKVTRYNIYKNGTFFITPSGVGTTYTDTAVATGESYTYSVQAGDGDGNNGPQSDTIKITATSGEVSQVVPPNTLTPNVPTSTPVSTPSITSYYTSSGYHDDVPQTDHPENVGLTAYEDKMEVTWNNPKGNTFKSVRVIKKESSYPVSPTDGKVICDMLLTTSCVDKEVTPGVTYYYGVYAADQSYLASRLILVSGATIKKTQLISLQIKTLTPAIATAASSSAMNASGTLPFFTKTLLLGSTGNEVMLLQKFLNTHGFPVATSGPGGVGNETTRFGKATEKALMAYQCSKKIICEGTPSSTGYGTVGKTTRGYLNKEWR